MQILHICDGWEQTNGAAKVARMLAAEQSQSGHDTRLVRWASVAALRLADEVWIHCSWKPCLWWAALWTRNAVRMPHGSFDPVRLAYHGWKKGLVAMVERWTLRRCSRVVVTCAAEAEWVRAYEPRVREIEIYHLRRYFKLPTRRDAAPTLAHRPLNVLYLGRRHSLKGVNYLERAVADLNSQTRPPLSTSTSSLHLKIISDHHGAELEADWNWCDVLVLPTLSENFGLVVAEALERGKRAIVTDGAPAWVPSEGGDTDYGGLLRYVRGYVAADADGKVRLLEDALRKVVAN